MERLAVRKYGNAVQSESLHKHQQFDRRLHSKRLKLYLRLSVGLRLERFTVCSAFNAVQSEPVS